MALPLRYGGVPRAERLERARLALARVGLGDRLHHTPIVLVTHDDHVAGLADRRVRLHDGRVVAEEGGG